MSLTIEETLVALGVRFDSSDAEKKARFIAIMKQSALLIKTIVTGDPEKEIQHLIQKDYAISPPESQTLVSRLRCSFSLDDSSTVSFEQKSTSDDSGVASDSDSCPSSQSTDRSILGKKTRRKQFRGPIHFLLEEDPDASPARIAHLYQSVMINKKSGQITLVRRPSVPICIGNPMKRGIWRLDLLVTLTNPALTRFCLLRIMQSSMSKNMTKSGKLKRKVKKEKYPPKSATTLHPYLFKASTIPHALAVSADGRILLHPTLPQFGMFPPCNPWRNIGDRIACEINMRKHTATFFVNKEKQNVLITQVPKCVQYQLVFLSQYAGIRVLRQDKIKHTTGPTKTKTTIVCKWPL